MAKYLLCGAIGDDGVPCNNNLFHGLYECKNAACSIVDYSDEDPGLVDPDALPRKKACPGCATENSTYVFECAVCGVTHDFSKLSTLKKGFTQI